MKATLFLTTLAIVSLSCQNKPKQETDTKTATVTEDSATLLAKRPGPDAPRTVPDRLVRALYFEHDKKENPFQEKKDQALVDEFFAKPTADIIWNDAQKSSGKVNRTKTNLLYNAPSANIKKMWVQPGAIGGTRAIVYVTFENAGKPEEVKIEMNQVNGRWGIADMVYPNGQHLTELLR